MSTHIAVHNLGKPRATARQLLQARDKFRRQANDRRKSSRNGKEEYFRKEVNGKRLDDWEDIVCCWIHSNRQNSGGTFYRPVADGIGDGPPEVGFGTQKNRRNGIKFYRSGSTKAYSKEFKRH